MEKVAVLGVVQSVVHGLLKDGAAGLQEAADLRLLREAKSQAYRGHGRRLWPAL